MFLKCPNWVLDKERQSFSEYSMMFEMWDRLFWPSANTRKIRERSERGAIQHIVFSMWSAGHYPSAMAPDKTRILFWCLSLGKGC
jgi:hypothetical protein